MKATSALSLALAAGIASTAVANETPKLAEFKTGEFSHAGHIYFNIATGEKITTLINLDEDQRSADTGSSDLIWLADIGTPCADFGYSNTSYFYGVDDATSTGSTATGNIFFDWGDIAMDTVIDCVQIHWISNHLDTDTDSDGIEDGIPGFMGTWTYWDGFNGRSPQLDSIAQPIVSLGFFSLPGELTGALALWTADIDLGATFGTPLTFEIGNSDGDLNGAAFGSDVASNDRDSDSIPDIDPDQDGLADWGWSIQFVQPGVSDVDNADMDSDTTTGIDGDIAALATAGVVFGSPNPAHAEYDTIGLEWNWISDGPTAGATEDAFHYGSTDTPQGGTITMSAGPWFFGGLNCDAGQAPWIGAPAHFQVALYSPGTGGPVCAADISGPTPGTPDGVLDFFDVSFFLGLFGAGDMAADISGPTPGTPDATLDFFDVSYYLGLFGAGCP